MQVMKNLLIIMLLCPFAVRGQMTKFADTTLLLDRDQFSIVYPGNLELNETGVMGTKFILFTPIESREDLFRENINLIIQKMPSADIDLNKFTQISEQQITALITDAVMLESKRIKSDATEYHKVIYTGKQGQFLLKFEQFFWVIHGHAYILTFTGEQHRFDAFQEAAEKVLYSFLIKT
jgi:hypothetical protein